MRRSTRRNPDQRRRSRCPCHQRRRSTILARNSNGCAGLAPILIGVVEVRDPRPERIGQNRCQLSKSVTSRHNASYPGRWRCLRNFRSRLAPSASTGAVGRVDGRHERGRGTPCRPAGHPPERARHPQAFRRQQRVPRGRLAFDGRKQDHLGPFSPRRARSSSRLANPHAWSDAARFRQVEIAMRWAGTSPAGTPGPGHRGRRGVPPAVRWRYGTSGSGIRRRRGRSMGRPARPHRWACR